jgi:hypothetical protein
LMANGVRPLLMPDERDDEDELANRVLLQTWREWRRTVTREEAEAEAIVSMEESPMFGRMALRDLEREGRRKN